MNKLDTEIMEGMPEKKGINSVMASIDRDCINNIIRSCENELGLKSAKCDFETFNNSPVSLFVLSPEGIILDVNKNGYELFVSKKEDLIGSSLLSFLMYESYSKNNNGTSEAAFSIPDLEKMECEIQRFDKTNFKALIRSSIIKNNNSSIQYILTTINDISDLKEKERKIELAYFKEKELNIMKSRFVTMASHEFRTPLASILLSAELIEMYLGANESEKKVKHLTKIKSSVAKLNQLLFDFLSTNQIENEEIISNPEALNLNEFISQLIGKLEKGYKSHSLKLINNKFINVYLDVKLLKACLVKLIDNAVKYSPKGTSIEISTHINSSNCAVISIKDYGIGILDIDKKNIFMRFYKGENAQNIEGVGLGLYDVNKLITLMGGHIVFRSKENIGTTFELNFPLFK